MRVLVVDDEEMTRFTLREILEGAGHEVMEAENGVRGLEAQRGFRCDLVITDIIMPDKEGVEFVKDLRSSFPNLPIIAISGGGRTHNLDFLEIARRFGANAILAKPFTRAALMAAIDTALSGDKSASP